MSLPCGRFQQLNDGLKRYRRQTMALSQIFRTIKAKPNFPGGLFVDERFQREIQRERRICAHEWRTGFGIPEDNQFGRPQRESDLLRFSSLINSSENLVALGVQ